MAEEVFRQDLSEEEGDSGRVFTMRLLFDRSVPLPDKETVKPAAERFLGKVEMFGTDANTVGISCLERTAESSEGNVPVMLMMTACYENDNSDVDAFERSQMWDCPDHDKVLEECKYSIAAVDMLAGGLSAQDRAELEMDWLSLLLTLFPDCRAVHFMNSGKLVKAEDIWARTLPDQSMFTYFAVNIRFFRIQGTEDMIVDTLGMSTVDMPDLQYHFHGADPNSVINHAYNVLCYILDNDCPIKKGDTIDGFDEKGQPSEEIQWTCSYERALIQPVRDVIDINMGVLASGKR